MLYIQLPIDGETDQLINLEQYKYIRPEEGDVTTKLFGIDKVEDRIVPVPYSILSQQLSQLSSIQWMELINTASETNNLFNLNQIARMISSGETTTKLYFFDAEEIDVNETYITLTGILSLMTGNKDGLGNKINTPEE